MPYTINGIGTQYWGTSNMRVHTGICRICGNHGTLRTYDTRLWFVVFFIPLIPLGRKRILDDCAICRRHFVAGKDQFELSADVAITTTIEDYREHPSVEAALVAHASLLSYHEYDQAAAFRHEIVQQFPSNGELLAGLGLHLDQVGQQAEALTFYSQAWEIRPDLPLVRDALARRMTMQGKLDEARKLLEFQMQPGAAQTCNLGALDALAAAYQNHGRHEEALELCRQLLAEYPESGQSFQFRKFVRKSERALRSTPSILPLLTGGWFRWLNYSGTSFSLWMKRLALVSVAGCVLLLGPYLQNQYIRQHRQVHFVSAIPVPTTVQVDNLAPIVVTNHFQLSLPEGTHHIKVLSPFTDDMTVSLQSGFFERWFRNPAWVINLGGTAVLCEWTLTYSAHATSPVPRLIINQKVLSLPHVDYIFSTPPTQLKVDANHPIAVKTHLEMLTTTPALVFPQVTQSGYQAAMTFGEAQMPFHGSDASLFQQYINVAIVNNQQARAQKYLNAARSRRPIEVNWHRFYQDLLLSMGREDEVLAEYRQLLKSEPGNGSLMFLQGRLEPDDSVSHDLLQRSTTADPRSPWPWYALALRASAAGDWNEGAIALENAVQRNIDPSSAAVLQHLIFLATGKHDVLVQHYNSALASQPNNWHIVYLLSDALVASGKASAAQEALVRWEQVMRSAHESPESIEAVRRTVAYLWGNFDGSSAIYLGFEGQIAESLLAAGRVDEAVQNSRLADVWKIAEMALSVSIAYALQSRDAEAKQWRETACGLFEKQGSGGKRIARILHGQSPPHIDEVKHLRNEPGSQLRLLAALSQLFPDARAQYAAEIAKINVSRTPPYHLVKQIERPVESKKGSD